MRARIIVVLMLMFAQVVWASTAPRIVQPFDFDWRFHLGDVPNASEPEFSDRDWRSLNVPHDFSREGDFSQTNASCTAFLPGGIGWYRKTFVVPADWQDKVIRIQFDGVSMRSHVWINGHEVGGWPYAYSTFELDLTPYVNYGETNVIAVRVDRSAVDDSRWYPGSGIERHVWLMAMEKVHVAQNGIYITTPQVAVDKAQIAIQTQIENDSPAGDDVELSTEIFSPRGKRVLVLKSAAAMVAHG